MTSLSADVTRRTNLAFGRYEKKGTGRVLGIEAALRELVRDVVRDELRHLREEVLDAIRPHHKPITLKQKLLRCPRIALATDRVVLNDHQCTAMGRVLAMEPKVRHSLLHPTLRVPRDGQEIDREMEFRSLDIDDVGRLCDDVIETIFAIDAVLDGLFGRASTWLVRRAELGLFGDAAFT